MLESSPPPGHDSSIDRDRLPPSGKVLPQTGSGHPPGTIRQREIEGGKAPRGLRTRSALL